MRPFPKVCCISSVEEARLDVPVILAGGLRAGNVRQSVEAVCLAGVDVCRGVRTGGALDPAKLAAFVAALGSA